MSGGGGPAAREAQDQEGQRRARPDLRRHAQPQRLNLLFGQPRYSIYRWKKRLPRYSFACHKPSVFLPLSWLTITSSLMTCPTYFCFLPLSWLTLKSSLMACPIYFILFTPFLTYY